ncbi:MAG: hypothetical protein WA210_20285 [Burkholderiaceae bacterium]
MGVNRVNAQLGGPKRTAAIQNFGSPGRNAVNETGPKSGSPKAYPGRSPARPTETNVALGSGGMNSVNGRSKPASKPASAHTNSPGTSAAMPMKPGPAGGLPGKGGPNRSGGTKSGKFYVKSEGF